MAARAGTSGPTVLRLAGRLGYAGFVELQAAVRGGLSERLRPAVERIRGTPPAPALARALEVELANVRRTLEAVDARGFEAAVALLADADATGVRPAERAVPRRRRRASRSTSACCATACAWSAAPSSAS